MKVSLPAFQFSSLVSRAHAIAGRAVRKEYDRANRISLLATTAELTLMSTNGWTTGWFDGGPLVGITTAGNATVGSRMLKLFADRVPPDATVELESRGDHLLAKASSGLEVQLRTLPSRKTQRPAPTVFDMYDFPVDLFVRAVSLVADYVSPHIYKKRYHNIMLHSLPGELRLICGEGMFFGIASMPFASTAESRHSLLAKQAQLIGSLLDPLDDIDLAFGEARTTIRSADAIFTVASNGANPAFAYEKHAYTTHEAHTIFDTHPAMLREALLGLAPAKLQAEEEQKNAPCPIRVEVTAGQITLVTSNPLPCTASIVARVHLASDIHHYYFHAHLLKAASTPGDSVRFFLSDSTAVVVADRALPTPSKIGRIPTTRFFFANCDDDEE